MGNRQASIAVLDRMFMETKTILLMLVAGLPLLMVEGRGAAAQKPSAVVAQVSHVDPVGATKLLSTKKVVILDIRTPEEFTAGHLAGAKNVDFKAADFEKRLSELDRAAVYLVHCQTGRRSTNSLETFKKLGFKSVVHLDGGYRDWAAQGNPVEK